jgi:hypothetical protein
LAAERQAVSAQTGARGVGRVEHRAELRAVMRCGVGDLEPAHEAMLAIDPDMVLAAEHRHGALRRRARRAAGRDRLPLAALQRPAAVAVDLPGAGGLPVLGDAAALHDVLLGLAQAGAPRLDDGRVRDLPALGQVAPLRERGVDAGEQPLEGADAHQLARGTARSSWRRGRRRAGQARRSA